MINEESVLKILMSDKTIVETISKVLYGQYISCRKRMELKQ